MMPDREEGAFRRPNATRLMDGGIFISRRREAEPTFDRDGMMASQGGDSHSTLTSSPPRVQVWAEWRVEFCWAWPCLMVVSVSEISEQAVFCTRSRMDMPLELNGKKKLAKASFALAADFAFARQWREAIGTDQNPYRTDTVDYAELAVKRYEASFNLGVYANSLTDFTDHIASNPNIEVGGFVVIRCDWFPGSEIIGFCHFRRSWCNKIILDYLGAHPFIIRPKEDAIIKVRGVGTALVYFVSQVLKKENCPVLWGEATSSSATFYSKIFKLEGVEDLIYAPRDNVIKFLEEREREWSVQSDVIAATNQPLDKIYTLETENPPFVGSKTAMFNPSKRLAFRYLKLAYHKQMEIAKALQFVKADAAAMPRDELAQIVFKGAREKGMLAALWSLVEKMYGDGLTEENPFETT
ncbi:MAG: hypothetical protein IT578_06425 [Verrucomicrobiae bacterium]|nr:hypothetical protein [Verrucomicrobiae bacterium]